jgi:hypothetical protein
MTETPAPKLTPKQEAFCQAFVETGNATEAYRRAFGEKDWAAGALHVQASKLLSTPKIRLRVDALQAVHAKRHALTVDDLVTELESARSKAMKEPKGASAAVSATLGKAKLLGLIIDRGEVGKPGDFARMTDAELERIAAGGSEGTPKAKDSKTEPDRVH